MTWDRPRTTGSGPQDRGPEDGRSLPLAGIGSPIGLARDFTRRALEDWGWTAPEAADPARRPLDAEDVVLLVSELVTNAAVHGGGVRELLLRRLPDALRVEVADASTPAPRPRHSGPGEPGGYGLHIVAKLSSTWGHHGDGPGKRVWAQVAACWPAPGRLL